MQNDADKLNNAIEHMQSILDDMRDLEPVNEAAAAAIHGYLREISSQNITALVAIGAIQTEGRKNGYA